MQAYIPCSCQEELFKDLAEFYGIKITCFVDKDACCTKLVDGDLEIKRLPAIIAYLERYNNRFVCPCMDQTLQMCQRFFEQFSGLMRMVENPKECQPKLFKYQLDKVLDFMKCFNTHVVADKTFLVQERKSAADVYMGFLLKNAVKNCVTEAFAKEIPNTIRYLKTVEPEVTFAKEELKLNMKK